MLAYTETYSSIPYKLLAGMYPRTYQQLLNSEIPENNDL